MTDAGLPRGESWARTALRLRGRGFSGRMGSGRHRRIGPLRDRGPAGARWTRIDTPWGDPSDELLIGELDGLKLVFLPRHGRGHRLPPTGVNCRANIDALKRAGVHRRHLAVGGGLAARRTCRPAPSWWSTSSSTAPSPARRASSAPGFVAHVSMAHPVCPRLSARSPPPAREAGAESCEGGTYLAMEGPQFSTQAESDSTGPGAAT